MKLFRIGLCAAVCLAAVRAEEEPVETIVDVDDQGWTQEESSELIPVEGMPGLFLIGGEEEGDDERRRLRGPEEEEEEQEEDEQGRELRRKRVRTRRPSRSPTAPTVFGYGPQGSCRKLKGKSLCTFYEACLFYRGRCQDTSEKRENYLFIGNSFTFVNNLDVVFNDLAGAGGKNVLVYRSAVGSATFNSHASSGTTPLYFGFKPWTSIILQEQSMFLSLPISTVRVYSTPFAKALYNMAKSHTSQVTLFQTWGYRYGNPSFLTGLDDTMAKMQDRIKAGYEDTKTQMLTQKTLESDPSVIIAYVGEAWRVAKDNTVFGDKLWQRDNQHPAPHGTYLAACVFYAVLFNESPLGLNAGAKGVPLSHRRPLQQIAHDTVFGN